MSADEGMKAALRRKLALELDGADLDDPATTVEHRRLILSKPILRRFYDDVYAFFSQQSARCPEGARVELGSGGGYLKDVLPEVITSDIMPLPGVDRVVSALDMPFEADTVSTIFMLDVLHHVQDAERFFAEADRCLAPGGRIVMVEPANSTWGRFVYRRFHHEPFEPGEPDWKLPEGGPMSVANGALPWMILVRDRKRFAARFPRLAIEQVRCFCPISYLVSGGVSMRQLVPTFAYPLVRGMEWLSTPLHPWLGMFMKAVVTKLR